PFGRMVEAVGLQIFRNIGIDKPDFAAARIGVGLGDCCLALTQRFHLGARERETRLECLVDEIVEARLAIVSDDAKFSVRLAAALVGRHSSHLSGSLYRRIRATESRNASKF